MKNKVLNLTEALAVIYDLIGDFIDVEKNEAKIKRLVAQSAIDRLGTSNWLLKAKVPIQVVGGRAEIPCDEARLLRVKLANGQPAAYTRSGDFIQPRNMMTGTIYISYYSFDMVEDVDGSMSVGIPVNMVDYFGYTVLEKLAYPMYLSGKLDGQRYQSIKDKRSEHAVFDAMPLSLDEIDEAIIMRTIQ